MWVVNKEYPVDMAAIRATIRMSLARPVARPQFISREAAWGCGALRAALTLHEWDGALDYCGSPFDADE